MPEDFLLDVHPGQVLILHDIDLLLDRRIFFEAFLLGHVGYDHDADEIPQQDLLHPGVGLDEGLLLLRVEPGVGLDVAFRHFLGSDLRKHVLLCFFRRQEVSGGEDEQKHEDYQSACRQFFHLNVSFVVVRTGHQPTHTGLRCEKISQGIENRNPFFIRSDPRFHARIIPVTAKAKSPETELPFCGMDS